MGKVVNIELNDSIYEQVKVLAKREKRPARRQIEWMVEQALAQGARHDHTPDQECTHDV